MKSITRNCLTCSEELPMSDFYENGYTPKGTLKHKSHCKRCLNKRKYERYKAIIKEYYKVFRCDRCGYVGSFAQFDCHHIDPDSKFKNISELKSYSKEIIIKELEKCTLLCANCHRLTEHY